MHSSSHSNAYFSKKKFLLVVVKEIYRASQPVFIGMVQPVSCRRIGLPLDLGDSGSFAIKV